MWAHHPSAWTAPRNNSESSANPAQVTRKRLMSKRKKKVIEITSSYLDNVNEEAKHIFIQFATLWYVNREEAIQMFENGGMPISLLRQSIWELCSRSCELLEQNHNVYQQLLARPVDSTFAGNILMDIERTLPCIETFDQSKVTAMKNILIAYSIKDNVIGYSQGMNYLAATIIFLLPEENAFWLLMRLMKGYSLEKLYPSPLSELTECLDKFEILLKIYQPDLQKHLLSLGAELHYYVPQWFQTGFLYTQRVDLSIRVLDLLIIHGIQALFRVGLSIFTLTKDALMSSEMSLVTAIDILKNLNLSVLTTDSIIKGALSFPNNLLIQTITIENGSDQNVVVEGDCHIS